MGDSIVAPVATAVSIVVRVTDSAGSVIPRQLVNFVVTKGGGSLFAGSAITSDSGTVREVWTLGTIAGNQMVEARAVDQTTGAALVLGVVRATAIPGPVVTSARIVVPDWAVLVGASLAIDDVVGIFSAFDAYGNEIKLTSETLQPDSAIAIIGDSLRVISAGDHGVAVRGAGGLNGVVTFHALDDLRQPGWQLAIRCQVGTDSLNLGAAISSASYTSGTVIEGFRLNISLGLAGTSTTWQGDIVNAFAINGQVAGAQGVDSIDVVSPATISKHLRLARAGNANFAALANPCASSWTTGSGTLASKR